MKGFKGTFAVFLLLCAVALSPAQKKKASDEDDDNEVTRTKQSSSGGGMKGTCSCRDMQAQIDTLETRLDTMIELWNDFVDKNKREDPFSPYNPPPVRRPPQGGMGGGRGPFFEQDNRQQGRPERPGRREGSGRYMDRDRPGRRGMMDDDDQDGYGSTSGPRRFRF